MAKILAYIFITIVVTLVFNALIHRITGNAKGVRAQKIIFSIFGIPYYLMIAVQIIKAFTQVNPSPVLY